MSTPANPLPQRLREVADALGSQAMLAKVVDKDRSTVNRWIHGTAEPDLASLIAISAATGLSVDYLLGLSDMKMIKESDVERYDLVIAIKNVKDLVREREIFIHGKKVYSVEAGDDVQE